MLKYASVAGFLVAVLGILALFYRQALLAGSPAGLLIQALSVLLLIWARMTFGRRSFHAAANPTEGGLVTSGPYRFLRHPIYASVIYLIWAGALTHVDLVNILVGAIITGGLFVRMLAEEDLVTKRYPEYTAYAARTKRVIPYIF